MSTAICFRTVHRLLIHHCQHHHSLSFFVISPEFSESPSLTSGPQLIIIRYLIIPQIHLSCGAFALHTILILSISQFHLNKAFPSWNLLYIVIWHSYINFVPLCLVHVLCIIGSHAPLWSRCGCTFVPPALIHCCYDSSCCKWVGRRITHTLMLAIALFFNWELNLWSCMSDTVNLKPKLPPQYTHMCGGGVKFL